MLFNSLQNRRLVVLALFVAAASAQNQEPLEKGPAEVEEDPDFADIQNRIPLGYELVEYFYEDDDDDDGRGLNQVVPGDSVKSKDEDADDDK